MSGTQTFFLSMLAVFVALGIFGSFFVDESSLFPDYELNESAYPYCDLHGAQGPLPRECYIEIPPISSFDNDSVGLAQSAESFLVGSTNITLPLPIFPDLSFDMPGLFSFLPETFENVLSDFIYGYSVYPYKFVLFILFLLLISFVLLLITIVRGI